MSRIRIKHKTGYRYEGDIRASYNEARMLPLNSQGQFVLEQHMTVSPNSSMHSYIDYWGTRVTAFEQVHSHSELTITAESLVEVGPRRHSDLTMSWHDLALRAQSRVELIEQLDQTPRTDPADEVAEHARRIRGEHDDPNEAALAICQWVYDSVQYESGSTGVRTTAREAWAGRRGVCQDISHIALGAMREIGIPARYVSGYLHPRPSAEIGETVTGESHAWLEWYLGDWRGFDPTNNIPIGERHVLVGRGRDYADVAPVRGIYAGAFGSRLFVSVEITKEA